MLPIGPASDVMSLDLVSSDWPLHSSANRPEYIAVYGSLRNGRALPDAPDLSSKLIDRGHCSIEGMLYDLGDYPGLKPGEGSVVGEMFEVQDLSVFRDLDQYERYDALHPEHSLYVRRVVRLREPVLDAWTYFYNGDVDSTQLIESGDWASHRPAVLDVETARADEGKKDR